MLADDLPDDLITTPHAARLAHTHHQTIRRWIASGKVRGYRIGAKLLVSRSELLTRWQRVETDRAAGAPELPSARRARERQSRIVRERLKAKGIR